MRKFILIGTVVGIFFCIMVPPTYPQAEKDALLKKESPAGVAADSEKYVIGPQDVLYIGVWKEEALSKTVTVRTDGNISLPLIDEVQAAGQTPLGLKESLTERFKKFLYSPNLSVTVIEANSYKVYVLGQVRNPGVIRLQSETSLAQIISMAGGFTDWTNQKKVVVVRKENGQKKIMTVNFMPNRFGTDTQLEQLRNLLAELETKYTQNHPDIVTTKKKIADLEQKNKTSLVEENADGQDWGATLMIKAGDTILVP